MMMAVVIGMAGVVIIAVGISNQCGDWSGGVASIRYRYLVVFVPEAVF